METSTGRESGSCLGSHRAEAPASCEHFCGVLTGQGLSPGTDTDHTEVAENGPWKIRWIQLGDN